MTKKPSVFVTGFDPGLSRMFYRANYPIVNSEKNADVLVFIGGADIDPVFYGERKGPKMNYTSMADDARDKSHWMRTEEGKNSQLKIGVCRGAQFLNVMNGGKLIQHANNHASGEHKAFDCLLNPGSEILITSAHHQMMVPTEDAEMIAYSEKVATEYWGQKGQISAPEFEPEALWYDRTRTLCVQFHPEYPSLKNNQMAHECKDYFFNILDKIIGA